MNSSNVKPLFRDSKNQETFQRDGYTVLPMLDANQIKKLSELYSSVYKEHQITSPVHSTSDTNSPELIKSVNCSIVDIFSKSLDKYFFDYKVLLSTFLIKEPGIDSEIPPHQDWTFVDEEKYASVSVWCPLADVNHWNGNITVLPGSHEFSSTIRASTTEYEFAYKNALDLVKRQMKQLPMTAGEALIYHHGLVHGSTCNQTKSQRVAVVIGVVPAGADLFLYYNHPNCQSRKVEKFLIDSEALINYEKHSRPSFGKSLGFVELPNKPLSYMRIVRKIYAQYLNSKIKEPLHRKLKGFSKNTFY